MRGCVDRFLVSCTTLENNSCCAATSSSRRPHAVSTTNITSASKSHAHRVTYVGVGRASANWSARRSARPQVRASAEGSGTRRRRAGRHRYRSRLQRDGVANLVASIVRALRARARLKRRAVDGRIRKDLSGVVARETLVGLGRHAVQVLVGADTERDDVHALLQPRVFCAPRTTP